MLGKTLFGDRPRKWIAAITIPTLLLGMVVGGAAMPAFAESEPVSDPSSTSSELSDPSATEAPSTPAPETPASETPIPDPSEEPTLDPADSITSDDEAPATSARGSAPIAPLSVNPVCSSDCASLTLVNAVVGGSATPAEWALGATSNDDTYTFVSGTSKNVPRDATYALTSVGSPAGYAFTSFTCEASSRVTFDLDAQTVTFPDRSDRNATCTFTYTSTAPVSITVHAGGLRTGVTSVGPLPDGAIFTATAVSGSPAGGPFTCATSGGSCQISVPSGFQWDVKETSAPSGYYLNPNLDFGGSSVVAPDTYAFRTGVVTANTDVPGTNPNGTYGDVRHPGTNYFSGLLATSVNNPAAIQKCGLNVALVLDQSGSMASNGKQASLKTAANAAIDALTGTPSTMAIYTFAANTGASQASTPTSTVVSAAPLHTFINNLGTPAGSTNWDAGLNQVPAGFDLVIFLTDGAPTVYATGSGSGGSSYFQYVEQGIYSANTLKAGGARVVGVGVGLIGAEDNLRSVSGPTSGSDYILASDTSFGDALKALATGTCNNQLSIQKQIQDPSGTVIANSSEANEWQFTNSISAGSTIASPVTTALANGQNGFASAVVAIPAGATPTVTVTETTKAGYSFVGASCSVNGAPVATNVSGTSASFVGASNAPMSCIFTNKQNPGTWSLAKSSDPASGTVVEPGSVVTYTLSARNDSTVTIFGATATDNLSNVIDDATLGTLPAGLSLSGSTLTWAIGNLAPGETKTVSYTVTVDADSHGATLTNVATPGTNGSCAQAADCTTTHTTPNEAHLTLVKSVNNGTTGGTKTDADWTLSANGGAGGTQITDSATGVRHTVIPGTYSLSESAQLAGYETSGDWVCEGQNSQPSTSSVAISAGDDVTCTITNTAISAKITLHKDVTNSFGGTDVAGDWTLTAINGATTVTGVSGTGAVTGVAVPIGTYALSEEGKNTYSYVLDSLVCMIGDRALSGVSAENPNVTLDLGQDVECFFTNVDKPGLLTLAKIVDNNDANSTNVSQDWTLTATPQFVSDQGVVSGRGDPTLSDGVADEPVFAGTYKLTESGPAGFTPGDWSCPGAIVDGDMVTVANGASVRCEITNTAQDPYLTLIKVVDNGTTTGGTATEAEWLLSADASASGGSSISGYTGETAVTRAPVAIGTYLLSESSAVAGYTSSGWSCDNGTTGPSVSLDLADDVTCTITNTAIQPTLTLNKVVDNGASGATFDASAWLLSAAGDTPVTDVATGTTSNVKAGTYVLSEDGPAGYSASSWNCGPDLEVINGSVAIELGMTVDCTVTNTAQAPTLTLAKEVRNAHGGTSIVDDWTLTASNGVSTLSGMSGVSGAVTVGDYALSESTDPALAGYELTSLVCMMNGQPLAGTGVDTPNLTLALGQDVTCFFTNTDLPALLTLAKIVDNNGSNTIHLPSEWTLTATPQSIVDQDAVSGSGDTDPGMEGVVDTPVSAGTYQLSESGPAGFTAGAWQCEGGSLEGDLLTVTIGSSVSCSITNTAILPKLTLVKEVDNNGTAGTGTPRSWTLAADGTATGGSSISGLNTDAAITNASVPAATYDLSESSGPEGYTTTGWTCVNAADTAPSSRAPGGVDSVTLGLGDDVTCTIVNVALEPVYNDAKTSDPVTGSVVQPGQTITYTVTLTHTGGVVPENRIVIDDMSNVLNNATIGTITPSQGTAVLEGTSLTWNTGSFNDTVTLVYSVTVNADAWGQTLTNVITPVTGGECDGQCSTTHYVAAVDLAIFKSHTTNQPDNSVVSGKDNLINYQLIVQNIAELEGKDDATGVIVTDDMAFALTLDVAGLDAANPSGDWDFSDSTPSQLVARYVGNGGVFVAGTSSTIAYVALVGDLIPPGSNLPTSAIDNEGCVAAQQSEANLENNCSPDVTTAKWVLIDPTPFCRNSTPYVFYSIPLSNGAQVPFVALIWWTPEAYAARTIGIDPADTAAVLADGASQVDPVPIPPGWQNGDTIEGEQLWPGAQIDAAGDPIAWPGWTQLASGEWVLDPAAPFYNIRDNAIVEVRTTSAGEATALAVTNVAGCDPLGRDARLAGLAFTGFTPLTWLLTGSYLVSIGAMTLWAHRRNRRNGTSAG
jgi:uncharacterized repeat protein (TIGR01451 family)